MSIQPELTITGSTDRVQLLLHSTQHIYFYEVPREHRMIREFLLRKDKRTLC